MLIALGLVLTLNRLTVLFAVAGAAVTVIYPFTKRFLSAPQFVLGIAFAWGVPMAFAAQLGEVPRVGWLAVPRSRGLGDRLRHPVCNGRS